MMFFIFLILSVPLAAPAQDLIHSLKPIVSTAGESAASTLPHSADHLVKAGIYKSLDCLVQGDRFEYWQDDLNGQFLAILPTNAPPGAARVTLESLTSDGKAAAVSEATLKGPPSNKLSFLISMPPLKPGKYRVKAGWLDSAGQSSNTPRFVGGEQAEYSFVKADKRNPAVPIPADGIPIVLEPQNLVADAVWPVRTGIPFPVNAVMDVSRLALFENGKPVPSQIKPTATWCPKGSVQWAHLDFLGKYAQGKPADYRLKLMPQPASTAKTPLAGEITQPATPFGWGRVMTCAQTDDKIAVDTGAIRFEVSRKKFTGIETAWFDPTGEGKYDANHPVIKSSAGPYLVDGRMIRFDASNDTNAVVAVEEQSPVRVTIRAEGWHVNPEGRVEPMCKFVTRITACTGQPMIRVSHHTIITYDTRLYRLADLGFHIGSALGPALAGFRLGADGATREAPLPAAPKTAFLHQDRHDHFRVVGLSTNVIEGAKSDGWFTVASTNAASPQITVMLRDIWQKFPKEIEMGRDGVTLHFWPKHGHRAFKPEEELDIKNIYKFWCFHQGALLDLNLPNDYFDKFRTDYASGTFECVPQHALNGNGQGLAIGNEFALLFSGNNVAQASSLRSSESSPESQAGSSRYIAAWAQLFQRDPAAHAAPEWNASTRALGKIAAADRQHFAPMEEAVEKGWLSHTRCIERGNEYGLWIWPDTHTYWNAEEDCAQLHRVWHNSHYHEIGQTWLMYYRSGSSDLLRWARAHTDHWMNIGTVNYAELDANGRSKFKFHVPGAMYHCKGLTPWGAELYGMQRRDDHAGLAGHWIDPDAFLWDWYLTGNERAREVYEMWAGSYAKNPYYGGTRREANTTIAVMVESYRATWDANLLPAIRGMGLTLRTHEPLEKQNPGPMWHPLWINRYYELTRDPEYAPFILKYGRENQIENTWMTALAALAYEISGDKSYLTPHFERVIDFPRKFYHAPGDAYDWYGVGPGPIGDNWGAYFCWGHFLHALNEAKITDVTPEKITRFSYLVGGDPSLTVLALKNKNQPTALTFKASSLGGDLHQCQVTFRSPSGKELANFKAPPVGGPSSWTEKKDLPADGETGLYRFELRVHEANVSAPITDLPFEAMLIPKNTDLETRGAYGLIRPSDETKPVELIIRSGGRHPAGTACNVILADADGKVLLKDSLFAPRNRKSVTFTFDPKLHKLPWKIDVYGPSTIQWKGDSDRLFLAPSDGSLKAIMGALKK